MRRSRLSKRGALGHSASEMSSGDAIRAKVSKSKKKGRQSVLCPPSQGRKTRRSVHAVTHSRACLIRFAKHFGIIHDWHGVDGDGNEHLCDRCKVRLVTMREWLETM